jgi:hypothetical protein
MHIPSSRSAQILIGGTVGGQIITSAPAARCLMRITFVTGRFTKMRAELWYEALHVA